MPERISSLQNQRVKEAVLLLDKSRERRERGLFVVEGRREFSRAVASGYLPYEIFWCGGQGNPGDFGCPSFEVSSEVYGKMAYRDGTEGLVAVMHTRKLSFDDISLKEKPLVLVLESVEKPGNIGAVLRTADAAGVDAVVVCDPLTDLYNPNLIRASLGAVFSVPVVACSSEEAFRWISSCGMRILTAQLQDSRLYYDTDMTCPTAIVFGTEDKGLTDFWRERSDARIRIPMAGLMDSLNVSVSAAILCFEAVRQRNIASCRK
ncbi:MAG: RNA methyltransferase [Bacteroidales bacterium]|nr:RNA methyltransferase [Candidatus Cacconaster merdequi]